MVVRRAGSVGRERCVQTGAVRTFSSQHSAANAAMLMSVYALMLVTSEGRFVVPPANENTTLPIQCRERLGWFASITGRLHDYRDRVCGHDEAAYRL